MKNREPPGAIRGALLQLLIGGFGQAANIDSRASDRTATQKDGSDAFPIELKSVLLWPKSHPLYKSLIRGGYCCKKMGQDAFPIRLKSFFSLRAVRPDDSQVARSKSSRAPGDDSGGPV
jgi:hypothetical protein